MGWSGREARGVPDFDLTVSTTPEGLTMSPMDPALPDEVVVR
jgi:hypothetical protein